MPQRNEGPLLSRDGPDRANSPVFTALAEGAALQFARFTFPAWGGKASLSTRIFQLSHEGP